MARAGPVFVLSLFAAFGFCLIALAPPALAGQTVIIDTTGNITSNVCGNGSGAFGS